MSQDQPAVDYYDALGRLLVEGLEFNYSGLKHSYLDAFQRLLGDVVQEIGAAPAVSRPELAMLGDFAVWEKNVRSAAGCGDSGVNVCSRGFGPPSVALPPSPARRAHAFTPTSQGAVEFYGVGLG